jgi:hypothetical protein
MQGGKLVSCSKTLVPIYQLTYYHNPENMDLCLISFVIFKMNDVCFLYDARVQNLHLFVSLRLGYKVRCIDVEGMD